MSAGLPIVSGKETVAALQGAGFSEVRQRGSHVKLRHPRGLTVIVPLHPELARGTLRSVLRQADLTVERFRDLLR